MTAKLLEGKELSEKVMGELKKEVEDIRKRHNEVPKLVSITVGDEAPSEIYRKMQERAAADLGIEYESINYHGSVKEDEIIYALKQLNRSHDVNGIIVEKPLPKSIDIGKVVAHIFPHKDAEGIHADNLGLLVLKHEHVAPCTAMAAMELLESTGINLHGAEVCIIGNSKIVGRPLALLLTEKMATITVCTVATSDRGLLEGHVKRAEVLIVAVGKPNLIPGDWIKEGSTVIDIGINAFQGKIVGDVDLEGAKKRAAFVTPVPGGIGPLTVTMLMKNLIACYRWQRGDYKPFGKG